MVMFSSYLGGFITDPALWSVPPDDHMVHRGDGVFEAFKIVNGRIYCLDAHLARLKASAAAIDLTLPPEFEQIVDIVGEAFFLGQASDVLVRVNVSRGPGSFTVNPYEAQRAELYVTTTLLRRPSDYVYAQGVKAWTAPFPAQTAFAHIKSFNYLPQVLAKKAALDQGADYVISFDENDLLTEGATENALVVTQDQELLAPSYERVLKGVTLGRVLAHAQDLVKDGRLKWAGLRDISRQKIEKEAQELFLTASTFDVLAVTNWNGQPVGDGKVGPIVQELTRRLNDEIHSDNPFTLNLLS
jgi:branched-chain amino acid aminotransferase